MKELLEHILKNIVTNPDALEIKSSEEEGREVYTISVDPQDMGRVIGKNGKVIKAIRALAHVVAIRQNKRFRINLADETGAPVETAESSADTDTNADFEPAEEVADVIDLSQEPETTESAKKD